MCEALCCLGMLWWSGEGLNSKPFNSEELAWPGAVSRSRSWGERAARGSAPRQICADGNIDLIEWVRQSFNLSGALSLDF